MMAAPTDPGDFTAGLPAVAAAVNLRFKRLYDAVAAGALDETQFASALLDKIGVSSGATVRRGKAMVAAAESRSNAAYGLLGTPDRVSSVVLPTDGILRVRYQAIWQEQTVNAARAAIFLNGNQLTVASFNAAPLKQAAATAAGQAANRECALHTAAGLGLVSAPATIGGLGEVSTGQVVGGAHLSSGGAVFTQIELETLGGLTRVGASGAQGTELAPIGGAVDVFAAAGTYDVSVQFKASSGSVTVKNRHLWVEAIGF